MKRKLVLLMVILLLGMVGCGQKQTAGEENKPVSADENSMAETVESIDQEELIANLEKNLDIMTKEPKNTDARIEVIKSQIGLKNYDVALINLSMLMSINPRIPEIYDLYVKISQEEDDISIATNAVSKAYLYDVQEFLDKVTDAPVLSLESGSYDDKITVEITNSDPEAEIYYRCYGNNFYGNTSLYTEPIDILADEIRINAYALKDGVPSKTVECTYNVNYSGEQVIFKDALVEQAVRDEMQDELGYVPDIITDVDCWKLSYLYINGEEKNFSIEDLKWFPNLQTLQISSYGNGKVVDYSPLKYCSNIYDLYLSYGKLTSIDFVENMKNLRSLYVGENDIRDMSALKNCKNLQYLEVSGNPVSDIDKLLEDKNLYYLEISDYQISDYATMEKMENLDSLSIIGNELDTTFLAKLTGLRELRIQADWDRVYANGYYNMPVLKDISFLQSMPDLEYLYLNGVSDVTQLSYLYELKNLDTLYLYESKVTDNQEAMQKLKMSLPNCDIRY